MRAEPRSACARLAASGNTMSLLLAMTVLLAAAVLPMGCHNWEYSMNFASDNTAGIAPEILQALVAGNDGFAMGYGNDDITRAVERRVGEILEPDVAALLVPTGPAANALALAHASPPWGAVFAHAEAHILTDECGAPEFFGGGLKLVGMPGVGCKVTPEILAATVSHYEGHTPHQVVPAASSFAQATEAGTIYRPAEIAALAKVAHAHGMKVHM